MFKYLFLRKDKYHIFIFILCHNHSFTSKLNKLRDYNIIINHLYNIDNNILYIIVVNGEYNIFFIIYRINMEKFINYDYFF